MKSLCAIAFLVLALGAMPASAQNFQVDVQAAANLVAFTETIRTLEGRGYFDKEAADALLPAYTSGLSAILKAHSNNEQQTEALLAAVRQAAAPHRAALQAIYSGNAATRAVAGFPGRLPTPEAVLASVGGSGELDTASRQVAAFKILRDAIEDLTGRLGVGGQPPELAAYYRLYMIGEVYAQARMQPTFDPACRGEQCPRARFVADATRYQFDPAFQREFLGKHWPQNVVAAYIDTQARLQAQFEARQEAERAARPATTPAQVRIAQIIGIILLIAAVLGAGYLVLKVLGSLFKPIPRPPPPPVSDNFGKAEFEPLRETLSRPDAFSRGVFLGKSASPQFTQTPPLDLPYAPAFTEPEAHTLVVARTRTGKGTRVIVPTLLRYEGSVLTIDPKGENAAISARARKVQLGQTVHIVNPWHELVHHYGRLGLSPPATYNPLDVLDRNDPNAVAVAQALAATVCPSAPGDKDRFWQGSAANVLAAVFLWLADHPNEQKTLARARDIVSQSRKAFTEKYLVHMAASEAFGGAVREMVSQLIDMADETYSGVMSNLNEATKFLSDPQVKASTAASSFSMEDLIFKRTTVYLVLPPDRMETQKTWLRLVLTAAMQTFKKHRFDKRREGRCMFLIDEFAALGRMDDVPRDIATMSGYGLDFTLVVQGLDQLKASYGESADTILNNCAWKWFCNISDLSTAKYVSDSLGNKTVRTVGMSETVGNNPQGGISRGESTTFGEAGRPLLRHEEILTLGRDFAIGFQPKGNPLFLQPIDYWNLQEAFAHMTASNPKMYWQPPLMFDPNPYAPGSERRQSGAPPAARNGMTDAEAREILEVGPSATRAEILSAYKRLMAKVHPDRGGSNFFAKQLNAARAVLLGDDAAV